MLRHPTDSAQGLTEFEKHYMFACPLLSLARVTYNGSWKSGRTPREGSHFTAALRALVMVAAEFHWAIQSGSPPVYGFAAFHISSIFVQRTQRMRGTGDNANRDLAINDLVTLARDERILRELVPYKYRSFDTKSKNHYSCISTVSNLLSALKRSPPMMKTQGIGNSRTAIHPSTLEAHAIPSFVYTTLEVSTDCHAKRR